jgi:HPt (histidine-containing phosphotransfer) domain-containing protein
MMDLSKHTDLEYLEQLSNGSNEFVCQMIDVFMEQTPAAISKMEETCAAADWSGLAAIAHKIKPSLSFMGIKELEPVIMDLEHNAKTLEDTAAAPRLIAKIKEICNAAMLELRELKPRYS